MNHIAIQSINYIDLKITVLFDQHWFQEDIINLQKLLLKNIPEHNIKEVIQGADRENIRFQWQDAEFILHFDYYSQSCWFSAQDEISTPKIQALFNIIMKNEYPHV